MARTEGRVRTPMDSESKTQQHMKDQVSVKRIIERHVKTGMWERNPAPPSYGDFTNAVDYMTAKNAIAEAQSAFNELPWQLRERFDNDPANLLAYLEEPGNRDEAYGLGLLEPPEGWKPPEPAPAAEAAPTEPEATPQAQPAPSSPGA